MKKGVKKWIINIAATGILIACLLIVIVVNPALTYANKTVSENFTIYHKRPLVKGFEDKLKKANNYLKSSEFYKENLQLDICLNDGAVYPTIIGKIKGSAFAFGFYDKVVLQGEANCQKNYVALNGYKWNLTQLLVHEMVHCLQFDEFGFWHSNPVANIPEWKWEGYAEYISRKNYPNLKENIALLESTPKDTWAVELPDSTISPRHYYDYWMMVQYAMEVKGMNYHALLKDDVLEKDIRNEMMSWYKDTRK